MLLIQRKISFSECYSDIFDALDKYHKHKQSEVASASKGNA